MPRTILTLLRLRRTPLAGRGLPLVLLLAACPAKGPQPIVTPAPATTPATDGEADEAELRRARLARLSQRLEQAREAHHVPGMAVAVVQDDQVVFAEGFGLADLATGREATPETLFAVGSTTKAFTATLVAMMVDEGKLSWDDEISRYVPELVLRPRPAKEGDPPPPVTLRDVLCHRTGFTRMSLLWASGALPTSEVLAKASNAEPWAAYREQFLYNNVTFAAAGEAAARVAHTDWATLLQQRLLDPLGMRHTNVTLEAAAADPALATGYRWREVAEAHEAVPMRALQAIAPAGAINSTVLDMSQWLRLQLGRGTFEGTRLVSTERIVDTWSPQIEVGGGIRYGLGWMLGDWQGHRVVEHGGNIDGFAAEVAMLPDDGIGFVLLTNTSATPLQRESMSIVFDSLLGELPSDEAGEPLDLRPYPGKYVADFATFDDARFTVTAEGGRLFVDVPGQTKYALEPPDDAGRWRFSLTDTIQVYFELDAEGRAQVLHMLQAGYDFELPREGYAFPPELEPAQVAAQLGRYRDEQTRLDVTVRLEGGRLVADIAGQTAYVLRKPDEAGRWRFRVKDDLAVEFRQAGGAIDAIVLHQGESQTVLPRTKTAERPLPTVDQLLRKAGAAAFAARLRKLGAVELRGTVRLPSSAVEGRFSVIFDAEGRHRTELDFGPHGRSIDTYDGTAAWTVSTLAPPTEHQGKYLQQIALGSTFMMGDWTRGYDRVEVEGRRGEGDDERIVVVLRAGDLPPLTALVDPKRGEIRATQQVQLAEGAGTIPVQTELHDYRRAAGLRLPHRIRTQNVHAGATVFEVQSVARAQGDPAALFGRPTL
ncbi:MAG: serine hydrolase [Myxococcales bacterium]|nr:serine hydrolase [Myxococcales bacterium]